MARRALNATAASLLGFLHDGPMTGWDLVAAAEGRIGDFWSLTQSQVYRELAAMADDGLITAGERGRRDRRPYTLTPPGRAAFAEWLHQDPGQELIRFPLLLVVMFGRHLPAGRLAQILAGHRELHADRLAGYEATLAERRGDGLDPYAEATLTFGVMYERTVLAWFDALPPQIRV